MALIAVFLLAGLIAGFAARGSLRNFERVHIRWWAVALLALGLQIASELDRLRSEWAIGLLIASYVLLIAFAWINRRLPAAPLILIGLVLNLAVIGVNRGMPVSAEALEIAKPDGQAVPSELGEAKRHIMTGEDVLRPLGDVIPIPPPFSAVVSIGDLFLYTGLAGFVVLVMLGRFDESAAPRPMLQMYRGKHLPLERRLPGKRRAPPPASRTATARPGTEP
jgi:hypothetical protein